MLSDEQLAAMKARQHDALRMPPGMSDETMERIQAAFEDRLALLAEVERLREQKPAWAAQIGPNEYYVRGEDQQAADGSWFPVVVRVNGREVARVVSAEIAREMRLRDEPKNF